MSSLLTSPPFSQLFFLGYVICSNTGVHYGTGQHRDDLTPENYATAKKVSARANSQIPTKTWESS